MVESPMPHTNSTDSVSRAPYTLLLGVAQDGGYPQAGCRGSCCAPAWGQPELRARAACLGIIDPVSGERWLIDASPDLPAQLHALELAEPSSGRSHSLSGVLLTHGHIGHYTGLMYLGREAMGAQQVPVFGMPRMLRFLEEHGPWEQLHRLENITLRPLTDGVDQPLNSRISVRPFVVPHRGEYTETVGMVVSGPSRRVLYLPDIDRWERNPSPIEALLEEVDCAYIDGTFFDSSEQPHREREEIPHPTVSDSLVRFAPLGPEVRGRVHFFHHNHSNPLLHRNSQAAARVEAAGMRLGRRGMRFEL
jgi:pyrroloquinoline quinone biosynthesis protein B